MSIRHVDDVMRAMQRPHDDGAQRLCFRFLQQPCVEVMIDTHDRVGEIIGDSVVHTHKTRKAPPEFAAAFVTADTHADLNGVVKHTLEVSKVSFAPIDAAVEATGMESGGMSPIGLPDGRCSSTSMCCRFPSCISAPASARPNWWSTARSSPIFPASDSSPVWASPGSKTPRGRGRVAQASRILDEDVNFLCLQ